MPRSLRRMLDSQLIHASPLQPQNELKPSLACHCERGKAAREQEANRRRNKGQVKKTGPRTLAKQAARVRSLGPPMYMYATSLSQESRPLLSFHATLHTHASTALSMSKAGQA
jgi:hypothetical protein